MSLPAPVSPTFTPEGSQAPSVPSPWKDPRKLTPDPPQPGGFPRFADGDVLIRAGTGMYWKLHSANLKNASSKLKDMFEAVDGHKLSAKDKELGKMMRWTIDMVPWSEKPNDNRFRDLVISKYGSKTTVPFVAERDADNAQPPFVKTYDNFFRVIYSINPVFASEDLQEGAYYILDAITLLQSAESLDSAKCVRVTIEAHLIRLNQILWKHIQRNCEAWADIAIRLESPTIFREAMAHIIGKFDLVAGAQAGVDGVKKEFLQKQENGRAILELAAGKARELKDKKLLVERALIDFYPKKIVHGETENNVPGRSAYTNDIYEWMALTMIRQYIASSILANMHHRAPDGGTTFYRIIGQGGGAYCRSDTLDRFHETFVMSTKGKQCMQAAVDYIKESLRPLVAELTADYTSLTGQGTTEKKLPYLTCAKIRKSEMPWVVRRMQQQEEADRRAAKEAQEEAQRAEEANMRALAEAAAALEAEDDGDVDGDGDARMEVGGA